MNGDQDIISEEKSVFKIGTTIEKVPIVLREQSSDGLSSERKHYLYSNIREYCTAETRDVLCPFVEPISKKKDETDEMRTDGRKPKRGRGISKKKNETDEMRTEDDPKPKRDRGRPKKRDETDEMRTDDPDDPKPKRGRGRPKKKDETEEMKTDDPEPKRGRGRPKKF